MKDNIRVAGALVFAVAFLLDVVVFGGYLFFHPIINVIFFRRLRAPFGAVKTGLWLIRVNTAMTKTYL